MKTSTFLSKVLNGFRNGKSYTTKPDAPTYKTPWSYTRDTTAASKGRTNLIGMIEKVAAKTGVNKQKAMVSIARSLGHTNVVGFGTSPNTTFSKVKPVIKAAIKRERAAGN